MYFAYLDESGDSGATPKSPTRFFVLCCVLVDHEDWSYNLDKLVELRRDLKRRLGIPTRAELKGNYLVKGSGVFSKLGLTPRQRIYIYNQIQEFQARELKIKTFAVAINKIPAHAKGWEARTAAWTFMLQRIHRFCGPPQKAVLFPDEGHGFFIRKKMRAMRRYHQIPSFFGGASRRIEITRVIEDPSDRQSHDSYFVQLADLNAYAAHRYVDPKQDAGPRLWNTLSPVLVTEVNKLQQTRAPQPPAIVLYPP